MLRRCRRRAASIDRGELPRDDLSVRARLALGQRLADADDRRQAARPAPRWPSRRPAGRSRRACAPLRMADDDVAAAELGQHRRRRPRRCRRPTRGRAVLRAPGDRAAGERVARRRRRYGAGTQTATSAPQQAAPPSGRRAARRWPRGCRSSSSCRRRACARAAPAAAGVTTRAPACRCAGSTPSARAPRAASAAGNTSWMTGLTRAALEPGPDRLASATPRSRS